MNIKPPKCGYFAKQKAPDRLIIPNTATRRNNRHKRFISHRYRKRSTCVATAERRLNIHTAYGLDVRQNVHTIGLRAHTYRNRVAVEYNPHPGKYTEMRKKGASSELGAPFSGLVFNRVYSLGIILMLSSIQRFAVPTSHSF